LEHLGQARLDLALDQVGAGDVDAIATDRSRRRAGKMVVLVGSDDEERIVLGDTVRLKSGEKINEGRVEFLELGDVIRLARAKRAVRIVGKSLLLLSFSPLVNHLGH
jgi:hypothetical protein